MYLTYTNSTPSRLRFPEINYKVCQPNAVKNLGQRLTQLGQALCVALPQSQEPRIREVISADGQITWEVYEPVSKLTQICSNRSEVKAWLAQ